MTSKITISRTMSVTGVSWFNHVSNVCSEFQPELVSQAKKPPSQNAKAGVSNIAHSSLCVLAGRLLCLAHQFRLEFATNIRNMVEPADASNAHSSADCYFTCHSSILKSCSAP